MALREGAMSTSFLRVGPGIAIVAAKILCPPGTDCSALDSAARIASIIPKKIIVEQVVDMQSAVLTAQAFAQPGDNVLLAPACASFDMFNDFEHRGDVFVAAVESLLEVSSS